MYCSCHKNQVRMITASFLEMSFKDKVVVVTGASAGIGKAVALRFSQEGARLVLVGRNEEALRKVGQECRWNSGHQALELKADLSKDEEVESVVAAVTTAHGALHVLVNNAAIFVSDDIFSATTANLDLHMNNNLRSVFNLTRLFVPLLVKSQGNIINMSGVAAVKYCEGLLTESLSKVAVQYFTKCVAKELGPKKVRANSLSLGLVVGTKIMERANLDIEEFIKDWLPTVPLGELIHPEDVAKVVTFLASDDAKHITGQVIVMDGGFSCH